MNKADVIMLGVLSLGGISFCGPLVLFKVSELSQKTNNYLNTKKHQKNLGLKVFQQKHN